jgi:hypothetical protein
VPGLDWDLGTGGAKDHPSAKPAKRDNPWASSSSTKGPYAELSFFKGLIFAVPTGLLLWVLIFFVWRSFVS